MSPYIIVRVVFVCFLYIHDSEADSKIVVKMTIKNEMIECNNDNYTVYKGDTLYVTSDFNKNLNFARISITDANNRALPLLAKNKWKKLNGKLNETFQNVTEKFSGTWSFEFLTFKNIKCKGDKELYINDNYTRVYCDINVEVKYPLEPISLWVYISVGIGTLVIIVILAQTVIIIYLKKKAQLLLRNQNFKPGNKIGADGSRYSLTPGQRASRLKKRGDSGIYETLEDIKLQNQVAPVPPTIDTLPKSGTNKLQKKHQLPTIPASPKSKHIQDLSRLEAERMKDRPKLPLPCEETYEEVETEENNYEPPPLIHSSGHVRARPPVTNKLPPVTPIPLTLPGKRMEPSPIVTRPEIPGKAQKIKKNTQDLKPPKQETPTKPAKPAVKSKKSEPKSKTANELDNLLKKRRNDAPIMVNELDTILKKRRDVAANKPAVVEPAATAPVAAAPSLRRLPPKSPLVARPNASNTNTQTRKQPAPLPVAKPPCPLPAPVPAPKPNVFQNDDPDPNSSDEEWTYEPLPQYNIYSI